MCVLELVSPGGGRGGERKREGKQDEYVYRHYKRRLTAFNRNKIFMMRKERQK